MNDLEIISKYNLHNHIPPWGSSSFQERILRFGIEFKIGKFEDPRNYDCINAIRQSFLNDMIKFIKRNQHLSFEILKRWISTRYK